MINYDEYVISYNKQAMNALKQEQMNVAYNLLSQAQKILNRKPVANPPKLLALTYNNLGCFYKRNTDYTIAIKFFHKSITEGSKGKQNTLNLAGTHLNLCTIYSLTVDHAKALSHGLLALELLKSSPKESESYIFSLIMAYQNIGMEYENISQYKDALIYYKKAINFSLLKLGEDNPLTQKIKEKIDILENKINLWSIQAQNNSHIKRLSNKISISCTPTLKKVKKRLNNSHFSPNIKKTFFITKKKQKFNYEAVENYYNNLQMLLGKPKKATAYSDISRDTTLNSERPNSVFERRLKTSYPRRKLEKLKKAKIKAERKHAKSQSRSPEILPVPFKEKLNLFDRLHNSTP